MEMKTCTVCKSEHPATAEFFYKAKANRLESACKTCRLSQQAAYQQRPEVKRKKAEYLEEYKQRPGVKERLKEYYKKHHKEYYQRPGVKQKVKEYREEYTQRPEVKQATKEWKEEYNQRPEVKQRNKKRQEEYRHRPDIKRNDHYKRRLNGLRKYGINEEILRSMQDEQRGCCKICGDSLSFDGSGKSYAIDHCHTTGKVRGLLCRECNIMLGTARDNEEILANAIEYLRESKG